MNSIDAFFGTGIVIGLLFLLSSSPQTTSTSKAKFSKGQVVRTVLGNKEAQVMSVSCYIQDGCIYSVIFESRDKENFREFELK